MVEKTKARPPTKPPVYVRVTQTVQEPAGLDAPPEIQKRTSLASLQDPVGYLTYAADCVRAGQWDELRGSNGHSVLVLALQILSDWKNSRDPTKREAARKALESFANAIRAWRPGPVGEPKPTELDVAIDRGFKLKYLEAGLRVAAAENLARKEGRFHRARVVELVREAIRKKGVSRGADEIARQEAEDWSSLWPAPIESIQNVLRLRAAAAQGRRALRRALGLVSVRRLSRTRRPRKKRPRVSA